MPNSKNVCFGIVFLHVILTKQKQLWHQEKHKQLDWLPKHNGSVFVFFLILPCFVLKPLTDGLVCSKCDHLLPHLLVVYQIVCSHGRAFVFKDLPWVGELVIAGKSFFFRYFKIAKQYGTLTCEFILHVHRLGRFNHSQFGFLHKVTAQIWFEVNFDSA